MKVLAALGAFVFGLIFGAPFFGALIMAAVAWAVVHLIHKSESPEPQPEEQPRREPVAQRVERPKPDLGDFFALRDYVQKLAARVQVLEGELERLQGRAAPRPVERPVPPRARAPGREGRRNRLGGGGLEMKGSRRPSIETVRPSSR